MAEITKKIKLPRKRKKRFISMTSKIDYMAYCVLGEIEREEGKSLADRFYHYKKVRPTKRCPSGYVVEFRF